MGLLNCQCGKANKEEMWNQLEMIFGMIDATLSCSFRLLKVFNIIYICGLKNSQINIFRSNEKIKEL